VESMKGKKAVVIFDNLRTEANVKDLQPAQPEKANRGQAKASFRAKQQFDYQEIAKSFSTTLDIRGRDKATAQREVEQWIDKALLLNQQQLKVLHGKGDGVLRNAVRDKLKELNVVKTYYSDYPEYGGEGITLVEVN
jgi:DNA mismatch repair protein MutS2